MSVRLTLICHASTSAVREVTFPGDEPIDAQGQARTPQGRCRLDQPGVARQADRYGIAT